MGNLIVKDNVLVEAGHKLGEVEQRLILLAILKARENCDSVEQLKGKNLIIHTNEYINQFGVTRQGAYKAIKQAVMNLYRAEWGYKFINEKGATQVAYRRFIQSADYVSDGSFVQFKFADDTVPMLVELERRFTSYEIEQIANLSSQYAMRLYEFFMRHLDKEQGTGWLKISLDDLRFRFGLLSHEYERMDNFKRKVLDYSMKEINKHTDLKASYTQQKRGRTIVGFTFNFGYKEMPAVKLDDKPNDENKDKPIDVFDGLTDDERKIIQEQIDDYIKFKTYQGEQITDFYLQNITKKAVREQWGLAEYKQKQAEQEAKQERIEKQKAERLQQQAQEQLAKQKSDKIMQDIVTLFESLPKAQQEFILDEVQKQILGVFKNAFMESRAKNEVHKNPMFSPYFTKILEM